MFLFQTQIKSDLDFLAGLGWDGWAELAGFAGLAGLKGLKLTLQLQLKLPVKAKGSMRSRNHILQFS